MTDERGEEVRALDEDIRRSRGYGEVWFGVWTSTSTGTWDPRALADRTTSVLGLGVVGTGWREILRVEAMAILVRVLRDELAYGTPLMSRGRAGILWVGDED